MRSRKASRLDASRTALVATTRMFSIPPTWYSRRIRRLASQRADTVLDGSLEMAPRVKVSLPRSNALRESFQRCELPPRRGSRRCHANAGGTDINNRHLPRTARIGVIEGSFGMLLMDGTRQSDFCVATNSLCGASFVLGSSRAALAHAAAPRKPASSPNLAAQISSLGERRHDPVGSGFFYFAYDEIGHRFDKPPPRTTTSGASKLATSPIVPPRKPAARTTIRSIAASPALIDSASCPLRMSARSVPASLSNSGASPR